MRVCVCDELMKIGILSLKRKSVFVICLCSNSKMLWMVLNSLQLPGPYTESCWEGSVTALKKKKKSIPPDSYSYDFFLSRQGAVNGFFSLSLVIVFLPFWGGWKREVFPSSRQGLAQANLSFFSNRLIKDEISGEMCGGPFSHKAPSVEARSAGSEV